MPTTSFRTLSFLAFAVPVLAQAQVFDFEASTATFFGAGGRPGAYTSLSQTNGGLTLDITRPGGTAFDVVENTGPQAGKPVSYGMNSLDPFFAPGTNGFIGNFSGLVTGLGLDFGDYGADADTLTLNVYSGLNGTGALLGSVTGSLTDTDMFVGSVFIGASGIRSFTINGTSDEVGFDNSVFIDNIRVRDYTAVPGPAALVPFAVGAMATLRKRRKRA